MQLSRAKPGNPASVFINTSFPLQGVFSLRHASNSLSVNVLVGLYVFNQSRSIIDQSG